MDERQYSSRIRVGNHICFIGFDNIDNEGDGMIELTILRWLDKNKNEIIAVAIMVFGFSLGYVIGTFI